jgi:hypothetical protein
MPLGEDHGMGTCQTEQLRWHTAVEEGRFGVGDLDPALDMVHYSPRWKERMGFANLDVADSTSFWRCRVHPDDLQPMLKALRSHLDGFRSLYEAKFRIRSNGSGYRLMLSRGLAVERDPQGHPLRVVGTMVDLTDRPASPLAESLALCDAPCAPPGSRLPFHLLLGGAGRSAPDPLLGQASELLDMSMRQVLRKA